MCGCDNKKMGLTIIDCPQPVESPVVSVEPPLVGSRPLPVTAAQIDAVACAIEHLLVHELPYAFIVDQLASEGGVAPWLASAGKERTEKSERARDLSPMHAS